MSAQLFLIIGTGERGCLKEKRGARENSVTDAKWHKVGGQFRARGFRADLRSGYSKRVPAGR